MRKISLIVIHCSATRADRDFTAKDVDTAHRFRVEFIKASQEAYEDSMMLNMGQWLSIPFILIGAHFMYHSFKPAKSK